MKKLAILIATLLLVICASPVYASGIPALPHAFYGTVTINGNPAPVGTMVAAYGDGVVTGVAGNPVVTTSEGIYGTSNPYQSRLIVQGNISDGAIVGFYVNGVSTGETAEWHSGEVTEVPLSVTITAPPPATGGEPQPSIKTDLFGTKGKFDISSDGIMQETIVATSEDGKLTLTIPKGTEALDKDGKPLESLESDVDVSPPDPPEDANVIGLAYDFGPDGATFDPPITLTFTYDLDDIPEGVNPEDLVLAYYDEATGEWVELVCVVDADAQTVTAEVSHFTVFAILYPILEPEAPPAPPEEPAPPPEAPALPPEAPAPPEVEAPELPALPAEEPEEPVPPTKEPEVLPPPAPEPFPWLYVGIGVAAVVVILLIVLLATRRRRY